jgi:poly(ADP-ribose) glycohydrolase
MDFANEFLGGGVLFTGNVQEEIRFSICPELVASMLFMECMAPNEAVVMSGFEQFSHYKGYGSSLSYDGDCVDSAEKDGEGNFLTSLCAIDAVPYSCGNAKDQFEAKNYMRDINKAYVGFLQPYVSDRSLPEERVTESTAFSLDPAKIRAVATGNWGCGAFGGDAQLKAMLQWVAASAVGCPAVIYYKFNHEQLASVDQMSSALMRMKWTAGELFQCLVPMCEQMLADSNAGEETLPPFEFLLSKLIDATYDGKK